MTEEYSEKISRFLLPWLSEKGYTLLKTEFVEEDHIYYLRVYIDLTEAERERRKEKLEAELPEEAEESDNDPVPEETEAFPEVTEDEDDGEGDGEYETGAETDAEAEVPGVGINDCAAVSRYLSKWLDKMDFIKETYNLEVCSKGFLQD